MKKDFYQTIRFVISSVLMLSLIWIIFPLQTTKAGNVEIETVNAETSTPTTLPVTPKKRALLVGISKYSAQRILLKYRLKKTQTPHLLIPITGRRLF